MLLSSATPALAQATTTPASSGKNKVCISFTAFNPTACANILTANAVNLMLAGDAFILGIAGEVLNVSIIMTLHIKDFVDATPAIFTVWKTIRDISGLFFIFFLLYAAIQMILGNEAKFGETIKNIVITAILINFSFFIVSLGIDASNIVSLAIYNQMLPNTNTVTIQPSQNGQPGSTSLSTVVKDVQTKGGISDIFMNSLKVSQLYDPKANDGDGGVKGGLELGPLKIILIGIAGAIMMFCTTISFLIASAAFVVRLAILIFILAFSPLLFLSWMSPELKEQTGKITNALKTQLVFMPVYLLLMYVALSVLNKSNLIGAAATSSSDFLPTGTNWTLPFIVLAINFTIVIFILNLPLVVGIAMSGNISKKTLEKFSAANIWKTASKSTGTWAARNTAGRLASRINESETMRNVYSKNPVLGRLSSAGLSKVSSAGFGGGKNAGFDQVKKKQIEARKKFVEGLGHDESAVASGVSAFQASIAAKRDIIRRTDKLLDDPTASPRIQGQARQAQAKARAELSVLLGRNDVEMMDEDAINSAAKSAIEKKENDLKNQRKNTATAIYENSRSTPAEIARFVSGGRVFKGPNKFYKKVARAIQKKKAPTDEIIDALKGELKGDGDKKDEKK